MSVKTPRIANNLNPGTYRGPSSPIWYDCPVGEFQEDPSYGQYFYEEFNMTGNAVMSSAYQGSLGRWSVYGAAGAFANDQALDGGVVGIGSDGDNEGVTLLSSTGSFRIVKTSTLVLTKKLWFEASVGTSTIAATKRDDFVGLAIPALSSNLPRAAYPITTTDDTLDATNGTFLGFHRKGTASPTDWSLVFNLAGGTINYPVNLTTLMVTAGVGALTANQMVKLGFVFDPNAPTQMFGANCTARQTAGNQGQALLTVFVNGIAIMQTFLSGLDIKNATSGQAFPTGFMSPCIATMNQTGTTPGTMLCDFVGVAQYADS